MTTVHCECYCISTSINSYKAIILFLCVRQYTLQEIDNKIKYTGGISQEQFYHQVFLEGSLLEGQCTRGQVIFWRMVSLCLSTESVSIISKEVLSYHFF